MTYDKQKQKCKNYFNVFEIIFIVEIFYGYCEKHHTSNHLSLYTVHLIYLLSARCLTIHKHISNMNIVVFSSFHGFLLSCLLPYRFGTLFFTTSQRSNFVAVLPNLKYLLISSVPNIEL